MFFTVQNQILHILGSAIGVEVDPMWPHQHSKHAKLRYNLEHHSPNQEKLRILYILLYLGYGLSTVLLAGPTAEMQKGTHLPLRPPLRTPEVSFERPRKGGYKLNSGGRQRAVHPPHTHHIHASIAHGMTLFNQSLLLQHQGAAIQ